MSQAGGGNLGFPEQEKYSGEGKVARGDRASSNQRVVIQFQGSDPSRIQRLGLAGPANASIDGPRSVAESNLDFDSPTAASLSP